METLTRPMYAFDEKEHLHTLDTRPLIGTTTALGVISKPLTWWASGMACAEFGWINPKTHRQDEVLDAAFSGFEKIQKMGPKEYVEHLSKAYRAHAQKLKTSAVEGVDLHAEIEHYIKSKIDKYAIVEIHKSIKPFVEWCEKNVRRFLFSEVHCYSKVLWTGGIADFAYEDMEGNYVLGDIKSSKEAYFSQWVQLGAYDFQIGENGGFDANGNETFKLMKPFAYHAIFAAGASLDKPFFNKETVRMKEAFAWAVNLYKSQLFFEGGK